MESRFNKYKNATNATFNQIRNINSFIDYLFESGLDTIEKEIEDLNKRINAGGAPPIFSNKVRKLIALGEDIESIHETYHFSKDAKTNA